MARGDAYHCVGNFWWQNPMTTPTPSVTILDKNIKDVAAYSYPGNPVETAVTHIAREIVIAVPAPDFDPLSHI
eukprot:7927788-Lingulodinium_polyedra.AAC.1